MTWVTPTVLNHVTSHFNLLRMHPVYRTPMPHTGTDYRAPTGTPLRAATAGTVVRSVPLDPRAGNYIRIQWGGPGDWIGYSHLSRRDVGVGQRVAAGQVVGLSGATGAVVGAHLHFEVSVSGVKVDPVPFLARQLAPVSRPTPGPQPTIPTPGGTLPGPLEEDFMAALTDDEQRRMLGHADAGSAVLDQVRNLLLEIRPEVKRLPHIQAQADTIAAATTNITNGVVQLIGRAPTGDTAAVAAAIADALDDDLAAAVVDLLARRLTT